MEADRNYYKEVGEFIRANNINYHNMVLMVENYFRENNFNDNEKMLVCEHIKGHIDLEMISPTILPECEDNETFDPTFNYHDHTLALLEEEDTNINNLKDKVKKVFIDNDFSHNQRLFYRHILLFHINMRVFEGRLKSSID